MSKSLSSYLIITEMIIISRCAPKIGPALYDPLQFESSDWISADRPKDERYLKPSKRYYLRADEPVEKKKKPCHGYDFDELKCKEVNNRILCGYEKNTGDLKSSDEIIDIGNGCRIRKDRIECGYVDGPFDGNKQMMKKKSAPKLRDGTMLEKMMKQPEPLADQHTTLSTTIIDLPSTTTTETEPVTESKTEVTTEIAFETHAETNSAKNVSVTSTTSDYLTNDSPSSTFSPASSIPEVRIVKLSHKTNVNINNEKRGDSVTEVPAKQPSTICVDNKDSIVCYETSKFTIFQKNLRKRPIVNRRVKLT